MILILLYRTVKRLIWQSAPQIVQLSDGLFQVSRSTILLILLIHCILITDRIPFIYYLTIVELRFKEFKTKLTRLMRFQFEFQFHFWILSRAIYYGLSNVTHLTIFRWHSRFGRGPNPMAHCSHDYRLSLRLISFSVDYYPVKKSFLFVTKCGDIANSINSAYYWLCW